MTRFWWVRHGPTHQTTMTGWRDVPADLSDQALISRLNAVLPRPAVLVSSDLIRATATADCLAEGRQRLPHLRTLREFNYGDWEGKGFDEISRTHPNASRAYWETPGETAPPNGESWNDLSTRVTAGVAALIAAHPGQDIIAVAHMGVILTQLQHALGIAAHQVVRYRIEPLSITCLVHDGNWRADTISHLP